MARVATETVFPTLTITGSVISINLSDLPGLTAAEASGGASDIRALAYALELQIAEKIALIPLASRPTGMTKTRGNSTFPVVGQRLIPFTGSYTVADNVNEVTFPTEV